MNVLTRHTNHDLSDSKEEGQFKHAVGTFSHNEALRDSVLNVSTH